MTLQPHPGIHARTMDKRYDPEGFMTGAKPHCSFRQGEIVFP